MWSLIITCFYGPKTNVVLSKAQEKYVSKDNQILFFLYDSTEQLWVWYFLLSDKLVSYKSVTLLNVAQGFISMIVIEQQEMSVCSKHHTLLILFFSKLPHLQEFKIT